MVCMHTFYWMQAKNADFDIVAHIATFWKLKEELQLAEQKVENLHFILVLLMLLPESRESYCNSFLA